MPFEWRYPVPGYLDGKKKVISVIRLTVIRSHQRTTWRRSAETVFNRSSTLRGRIVIFGVCVVWLEALQVLRRIRSTERNAALKRRNDREMPAKSDTSSGSAHQDLVLPVGFISSIVRDMCFPAPDEHCKEQAEFSAKLWYSSFYTVISIAAALYFRQLDCCMLAVAVLCASLNYWRHAAKVHNRGGERSGEGRAYACVLRVPILQVMTTCHVHGMQGFRRNLDMLVAMAGLSYQVRVTHLRSKHPVGTTHVPR